MRIVRAFQAGIRSIEGLEVLGRPVMSKYGYGSPMLDITAVADGLEARGWFVARQQWPPGINMHVFPVHQAIVEQYLDDLSAVTEEVRSGRVVSQGKAATYT